MPHYCYLIVSKTTPTHTYIGYTNNTETRIKKHNGLLKGGAKSTRKHKDWEYKKIIELTTKSDALSLEWYWKHYKTRTGKWSRTRPNKKLDRLNEIVKNFDHKIIL